MSVIPLSRADRDEQSSAPETAKPGRFDDSAFDKIASAAIDEQERDLERRRQTGSHGSLDDAITAALDGNDAADSDRDAFDRSSDNRQELREKFPGIDLGKLLQTFTEFDSAARQNPQAGAEWLLTTYAAMPYGQGRDTSSKPGTTKDGAPDYRSAVDRAIDAAFDGVDRRKADQSEFTATAEQRAALKRAYPHLSFDKAVEAIARIDRDMRADPAATAARVAAAYGAPVTETQHQQAAQRQVQEQRATELIPMLDHYAKYIPDLAELTDDIVKVLQHPEFKRLDDPQQNLLRAHRIAQLQRDERQRAADVAKAEAAVSPKGNTAPRTGSGSQSLDDIVSDAISNARVA
ncbi:hypothetical protein [Bradyrhizobium liaoningense]|uniref:hypothetical protein n=1 Tax=Bradyrhizobium liaoningense TaxID=43992 RepID=UPI001BAA65B9|nr:hypothetical protein [Bradyrhizobium liaoningense]MBR0901207.1 hypothetical protein [Bradyrhizobium liaoningense]